MPVYEVRKEYREIVEADDRDDAYHVFNSHMRDFDCQDSDCDEIKTPAQADKRGYDLDVIPWGGADNVTLRQIFDERDKELWNQRDPVYITKPDDEGESLKDLVPGFKKDIEVGDSVADGFIVFKLPDGSFRLETPDQREERLASGHSDREVELEIELAQVKKQARDLARRVGALED